jgi:N-hydroxyarylamine O-acetyltransferase
MDHPMHLSSYLARIGIDEPPPTTLEGLTLLHRAHLLSVPFENLDVQLGHPVTIDREPIFEKIVGRRRGGWCFEMNGVFGWALSELGFRVTRLSGGVMREMNGALAEGNHLVLRVDLDEGVYLADVGFGDGPITPMPLRKGAFIANGFRYGLTPLGEDWWRLTDHVSPTPLTYDVKIAPADEAQLAGQCAMLQTAPASPFVQNLVVQRQREGGITILRGRVLRQVRPDGADERLLESADDLLAVLSGEFGLAVPEAASLWPKIVERHEALFGG